MINQGNKGESIRDPDLIYSNGFYYLCFAKNNCIYLKKSAKLDNLLQGQIIKIYEPSPEDEYAYNTWAPEPHIIDGVCYIYTTMNKNQGDPQRMVVLSNGCSDVEKPFRKVGFIDDGNACWGIDGTILKNEGKLYYVWSAFGSYDGATYQALFINEMESPIKLKPGRYLLSKAEYPWELIGGDGCKRPYVNEGPFAVYHNNKCHIVYSASGCWTNYYCLGQLTFNGGNILDKDNWTKVDHPILPASPSLKGPGHASFLQNDPSGQQYLAFHAYISDCSQTQSSVYVAITTFDWDEDLIVTKTNI